VDANFHAIAGNTLFVSEAFTCPIPRPDWKLLNESARQPWTRLIRGLIRSQAGPHLEHACRTAIWKLVRAGGLQFQPADPTRKLPADVGRGEGPPARTRTKSTSPMSSGASNSSEHSTGSLSGGH